MNERVALFIVDDVMRTEVLCVPPLYPHYPKPPKKDNSFRGGSTKKGGKTKYERN